MSWIGIIEAAGNLAVVTVLGWRMRSAFVAKFYSLLAWQTAALLWFASNVAYGIYYFVWERYGIDWFIGLHYDATKLAQQLAIMALPLTTITLITALFRDHRKTSQRLSVN